MKPIFVPTKLSDGSNPKEYDLEREGSSVSALLEFYKYKNLRFNISLMGDKSSGKTSLLRHIVQVRLQLF